MSELALFKGGLPAYLKGMQDETTEALAGNSSGAKRISIEGGVFRMMVVSSCIPLRYAGSPPLNNAYRVGRIALGSIFGNSYSGRGI